MLSCLNSLQSNQFFYIPNGVAFEVVCQKFRNLKFKTIFSASHVLDRERELERERERERESVGYRKKRKRGKERLNERERNREKNEQRERERDRDREWVVVFCVFTFL